MHYDAYVDETVRLAPEGDGPLSGQVFAAKDVFAIKGRIAGAGCPALIAASQAAPSSAPVIHLLLRSGAALAGMTQTDELMFGVLGQNSSGTVPLNPRNIAHLPGGSSSGSAVAVAAGDRDFSLGTDTGGSVRIPASFCGIYGLRPTHGSVSTEGVVPLAPPFDTVGWFARNLVNMQRVGEVLLPDAEPRSLTSNRPVLWTPPDCLAAVTPSVKQAFLKFCDRLGAAGWTVNDDLSLPIPIETCLDTYKTLQSISTWRVYGDWITRARPSLGAVAARRFQAAAAVDPMLEQGAEAVRARLSATLATLLERNTVIMIPTTPTPAPRRDANKATLEQARQSLLTLCSLAGLNGLPQLTCPWLTVDDLPVGVSLIGARHSDAALIALAHRLELEAGFSS
jgi:amidase